MIPQGRRLWYGASHCARMEVGPASNEYARMEVGPVSVLGWKLDQSVC